MTSGPNVQFIGHDASRTGAPLALTYVLRWLAGNVPADLGVLLLDGGELLDTYESLAPTTVLGRSGVRACRRVAAGARSVGLPAPAVDPVVAAMVCRGSAPDVVVANTLACLEVAARVAKGRRRGTSRLVCYVHELDGVAARVLPPGPERRARLMASVDAFIAVGEAVTEMLVARCGIPPERVSTVPGFIEPVAPPITPTTGDVTSVENPVPAEGRPVVLGVGAMHRRKGPERFVDLMELLDQHPSGPQGLWLGGAPDSAVRREVSDDVGRMSDPDSVRLVSSVDEPHALISGSAILVSTAVEDPFPLVALEAGALGVPVVGFDSGGLRELLEGCEHTESLVPIGDLVGLAEVCRRLLDDPRERALRGRQLAAVVARDHLADAVVPRVWEVIAG